MSQNTTITIALRFHGRPVSQLTFPNVRAEMIRLHMPHHPSPRLISIHMQRIQELADIPQRGKFLGCVGEGGLDAEVEEPGVHVGCWGVEEDFGEESGDGGTHG